jgi:hypothetical protein
MKNRKQQQLAPHLPSDLHPAEMGCAGGKQTSIDP